MHNTKASAEEIESYRRYLFPENSGCFIPSGDRLTLADVLTLAAERARLRGVRQRVGTFTPNGPYVYDVTDPRAARP